MPLAPPSPTRPTTRLGRRSILVTGLIGGSVVAGAFRRKPARAAENDGKPLPPSQFHTITPRPMPMLSFTDADGQAKSLGDYAGRPLILHLWATWCPPCVTELPELARLAPELRKDGIETLAVSLDRGAGAKVKLFLARTGITTLPMYYDPSGKIASALDEQALPLTLLVNRDGKEIARYSGPVVWAAPDAESALRRMLD